MSVDLWVPGTADVGSRYRARAISTAPREVVDRCRVPTADGPCGHPFYEGEPQMQRDGHMAACVAANRDAVLEAREKQHPAILKPWDEDYAAWLSEHKRGIAEGRVRW